jgi:hypothetical protein
VQLRVVRPQRLQADLDALEPLVGRLGLDQPGVGAGQVRVGLGPPRVLEDALRPAAVALLVRQLARQHRGGREVGDQAHGLAGALQGRLGLVVVAQLGGRRVLQDAAPPLRLRRLDELLRLELAGERQRLVPALGAGQEVEERGQDPGVVGLRR